ncbi:MAG: hypothetical protein KDC98_06740 [Planctomycetes bacterium]|nr:hypothetical protein [Planctomycetota bacterium]
MLLQAILQLALLLLAAVAAAYGVLGALLRFGPDTTDTDRQQGLLLMILAGFVFAAAVFAFLWLGRRLRRAQQVALPDVTTTDGVLRPVAMQQEVAEPPLPTRIPLAQLVPGARLFGAFALGAVLVAMFAGYGPHGTALWLLLSGGLLWEAFWLRHLSRRLLHPTPNGEQLRQIGSRWSDVQLTGLGVAAALVLSTPFGIADSGVADVTAWIPMGLGLPPLIYLIGKALPHRRSFHRYGVAELVTAQLPIRIGNPTRVRLVCERGPFRVRAIHLRCVECHVVGAGDHARTTWYETWRARWDAGGRPTPVEFEIELPAVPELPASDPGREKLWFVTAANDDPRGNDNLAFELPVGRYEPSSSADHG